MDLTPENLERIEHSARQEALSCPKGYSSPHAEASRALMVAANHLRLVLEDEARRAQLLANGD